MQISQSLNIDPSPLLISACASAPALTWVQASERTYPAGPFDTLGIDAGAVQLDDSLRERFFGEALEGAASSSYGSVWEQDAADTSVGPSGGESVVDVASRCQSFVDAVRSWLVGTSR